MKPKKSPWEEWFAFLVVGSFMVGWGHLPELWQFAIVFIGLTLFGLAIYGLILWCMVSPFFGDDDE